MAKKSDNLERDTRIARVVEMITDGWSSAEICEYAGQKQVTPDGSLAWGVSRSQAYRYIEAAREVLAESAKTVRKQQFGTAINRLNRLYRLSLEAKNYKNALAVQREISTLLGLYQPNSKVEETDPEKKIVFYIPGNGR